MFSFQLGAFADSNGTITTGQFWVFIALTIAVELIFYVLRSIGVYALAKRQKIQKAWFAFIPCLWFYIVCKLLKKQKFFGKSYEKIALWLVLVFGLTQILNLAYQVLAYFPLFEYAIIQGKTVYFILDKNLVNNVDSRLAEYIIQGIYIESCNIDYNALRSLVNALNIMGYITPLFDLATTVITVFTYIALFRTYWPQHYTVISILCIFLNLFPIFVFVIRKKNPIDFNEYMRARFGSYARPYGPYGNPYGNPYNQNGQNPSSQGGYGGASQSRPDNPFEEFAGKGEKKPDDPFEEFKD